LGIDDFEGLRDSDSIEPKFEVLKRIFFSKPKNRRSLILSIFVAYKWEYLIAFFFCMVAALFSYISPFVVQMIINFLQGKVPDADNTYCFKLMGVLIGSQFMSYILSEHMLYYQIMIGAKSTNSLISLIYQK
jgi:ABC-type multidrug transport system fused ATPase/permease subunit